MFSMDVIEPAQNKWTSSSTFVWINGGTLCFSEDSRKVRAVTIRDLYLVLHIGKCIDFLGDTTVFATLSAYTGSGLVGPDEEDLDVTTFTSSHGLCSFTLIQFRLKTVLVTFQRAMEVLLMKVK